MPALLRKLKKAQHTDNGAEPEVAPQPKAAPQRPRDFFLLIPSDGGLAFRLFTFSDPASAASYLDRLGLPLDAKPRHVAFRALHSVPPNGFTEPVEAVVLIQDPERPGIVELYSFVDMESANSFVSQDGNQRLDMDNVMILWAAPVDLTPADLAAAAPEEEDDPVPAPTISVPLPPRPYEAPAATVATAVPPATTVPPATPRRRQKARQAEKPVDTRVRVPVTSTGAVFEPEPPAPVPATARPPAGTGILADIQAWRGWDGLAPLMIKSALANAITYDEFDRDPFATGRAKLIVGMAAFAAMIGAMNSGIVSAFLHLPAFALGWGAFVYTAYAMGTQAFPGERGKDVFQRLALCLALATTPAVLLVLGAVPTYGPLFVLGAYVWVLLTTTTAVSGVLGLNRDLSLIVATVGCLALFTVSQVIPLVLF